LRGFVLGKISNGKGCFSHLPLFPFILRSKEGKVGVRIGCFLMIFFRDDGF
jgi:hypothetical protein